MNSAYSHFCTIKVLCPDLDECLPCESNGKAVKLNSISLSEWCVDNGPEVGRGGVEGSLVLTAFTSGLIGGGYRH